MAMERPEESATRSMPSIPERSSTQSSGSRTWCGRRTGC